ncbi:COX15/CtaA family protein, partial [Burkholderia gladioli]|uniref:COX15/CtaA family protein n=1 Tax=Burkholderia gladioli TaxID=28095 RepID=UPI00164228D9
RYFAMAIGVLIIAQVVIAWSARLRRRPLSVSPWWPTSLLLLIVVQGAFGGWVSTNYAVLACTDFPTCNGQWIPPMNFGQGFHLWRALGMTKDGDAITQDALVAIHWTHRTFAFVVVAYLVAFALKMRRFESLRRPANGVLLVVVLQFLTGLTNIVLQWPLPVA